MEKTLLEEVQDEYKHPKRKKKEKKVEKKTGRYLIISLMVAVTLFIGVAYALEWYADWRSTHEYQFPIKWIGIVREIKREVPVSTSGVETVKTMTDMEVIEQYKLAPVLKTVYFLESTSGQNDGCKKDGKFNGFGYAQNSSQWKCYDSFADVVERVNEWYEERLAMNGNDLVESVCLYNKGIQGLQTCDYSVNFFGVLTKNF